MGVQASWGTRPFYRNSRPGGPISKPINPPTAVGSGKRELPAYISNGLVGLRVREVPLTAGLALLSGYTGEHPERRIEAAAIAPYPVAADLKLSGVWLSDVPHQVDRLEQAYDFSCGELNSRFPFRAADRIAWEEVNSPSAAERELGPVVI